jgi:hypothetical protein
MARLLRRLLPLVLVLALIASRLLPVSGLPVHAASPQGPKESSPIAAPTAVPIPSTSDPTGKFKVRFANVNLDYNMTGPVPPLEYGDAEEISIRLMGEGQCNTSTRLFVFVPTRPSSFTVREEIRRSWAADLVGFSSLLGTFDQR